MSYCGLTSEFLEKHLKSFCERPSITNLPPPLPKGTDIMITGLEEAARPLPSNWAQWLDMTTGEFFWINRISGEKTARDPRIARNEEICNRGDMIIGCSHGNNGLDNGSKTVRMNTSTVEELKPINYLVVSSCGVCLSNIMVPEGVKKCPKCGFRTLVSFC